MANKHDERKIITFLPWGYIPIGILVFICLGTVYAWSVFREPLEVALGVGATQSGLPYMFFLAFYAISMLGTGRLIEVYPPRKLMIIGGIAVGLGWLLAGYQRSITGIVLTYGCLAGSGVGVIYGVPIAVVSRWFRQRKGLAIGVILSGFGVSPLLMAPLSKMLIEALGIFKTFQVLGVVFLIVLVGLALPFQMPTEDFEALEQNKNSPQEGKTYRDLWRDRGFYGLWLCFMFGTYIGLMAVGITGTSAITYGGIAPEQVAFWVALFSVFNGLGRPLFGWLTDAFGPRKSAMLSYGIVGVAVLGLLLGEGNQTVYVVAFGLIWMTLGSWLAIAPAATGRYFGAKKQSQYYGIVFTAYGVGAVLGVLSSGVLKDLFGGYRYSFYALLLSALLGMMCGIFLLKKD